MPIAIDQVTAEVEPPPARSTPEPRAPAGAPSESEERRQADLLTRLARRAARLHAD